MYASDPHAESARAPYRGRFAQMSRGMEQRDPAQQHAARPARERLGDLLGPRAERPLGGGALRARGLALPLPVLRPEPFDDLAGAAAHGVAIFAHGAHVDLG